MATILQEQVWTTLSLIPKGKVTTYGLLAKYLNTKAVRAVATAVGKNPYAPKVPCHRVVCADGSIGQYSGGDGVKTKIEILKKEGVYVASGMVENFENILFVFE